MSDPTPFNKVGLLIRWSSKAGVFSEFETLVFHEFYTCNKRIISFLCLAGHIQPNLVISNSLTSNYRLSRSENLVPVYHETMTTGNKIMWRKFLLFSTLFYIYFFNFRSQITYSFVKCNCSIYCFLHSLNSDMSKYGYLEVFQWVPWNSRYWESTV